MLLIVFKRNINFALKYSNREYCFTIKRNKFSFKGKEMLFKRTLAGILVVFMYRTNKMWSHTGILKALTYSIC